MVVKLADEVKVEVVKVAVGRAVRWRRILRARFG